MNIIENHSLAHLNTFGFEVQARYFSEASSVSDLLELIQFAQEKQLPLVPLGGGSNVILSDNVDAVVVSMGLLGREILETTETSVLVKARAGENWHEFVRWTLSESAFGLENLSLIPGNVGAAPIQNIGAYGVEIKDSFYCLEAIEVATGQLKTFFVDDCAFGYRDSIFKNELCDRFIILSVTFRLDRVLSPKLSYGALREEVESLSAAVNSKAVNSKALLISDVVSKIRQKKLPDPKVLGNAGSFFKNPVVDLSTIEQLKLEHPDLVVFPFGDQWKLAAGWLVDRAGLKGFTMGGVGTYEQQALILVNYGHGTPKELLKLAEYIQETVSEKFGVSLEMEPRLY